MRLGEASSPAAAGRARRAARHIHGLCREGARRAAGLFVMASLAAGFHEAGRRLWNVGGAKAGGSRVERRWPRLPVRLEVFRVPPDAAGRGRTLRRTVGADAVRFKGRLRNCG